MSLAILGSGIVEGFVIALVAIGFTIIYNATRVVNFANGQFMSAGAYVGWAITVGLHWSYAIAIPAGVLTGALAGVVSDRVVIAPLRRATLLTQVMALLALSNVLDGTFVHLFGPETKSLPPYASWAGIVPGLNWSSTDLVIIATTIGVVGALVTFLYATEAGTRVRATADNPVGASIVGINPAWVALQAWALGGAISALGGLLILPKLVLEPTIGPDLTFVAFAGVVLGGFGSLSGAVIGGLLIGVAQAAVSGLLSAGYEPLVSLAVMLLVLTVRPSGLIGERA